VRSWLNPSIEDYEEFQASVTKVCEIYKTADELTAQGVHIYSTDEKMALQATEHTNEKRTMEPGKVEGIDPEYERHGTTGIIASRDVVTGEIVAPLIQPTRKEGDYEHHIRNVLELHPDDRHLFINDNLNTHMSESLVKLVAGIEGIDEGLLGVKGKSGILKNKKTRSEFLGDRGHRVAFVYTPKHCSWLNQIECWFSIITRRLLNRRASFRSVEELELKIWQFIDYYNRYLKKPFNWNFDGNLLRA
jgi:hypothetical protein